jgi:hypothetical protein
MAEHEKESIALVPFYCQEESNVFYHFITKCNIITVVDGVFPPIF